MSAPNSKRMVLRSDTRKLDEASRHTIKDGSLEWNNAKMVDKQKRRSRRRKSKADTSARKDQAGCFQFDMGIIWEILLRVSIETLLACRCVCKSWYTMMKNPSFIAIQMKMSIKRSPRLICLTARTRFDTLLLCDAEQERLRKFPLDEDLFQDHELMFSHNGLLCFNPTYEIAGSPVVICNPITKERIKLPRIEGTHKYVMPDLVGFCFVPARQKHLVVCIPRVSDDRFMFQQRFCILVSGESSWRWLTHFPCRNYLHFVEQAVYWNNAFYWVLDRGGPAKEVILSFDTIDETFQIISFPDDIHFQQFSLLIFNDRLCLMERHEDRMKLWEVIGARVGELTLVFLGTYDINGSKLSSVSYYAERGLSEGFVVASRDIKNPRFLNISGEWCTCKSFCYNPSLVSPYSLGFSAYQPGS